MVFVEPVDDEVVFVIPVPPVEFVVELPVVYVELKVEFVVPVEELEFVVILLLEDDHELDVPVEFVE